MGLTCQYNAANRSRMTHHRWRTFGRRIDPDTTVSLVLAAEVKRRTLHLLQLFLVILLDIHPFLTTRAAGLAGSVPEPLYEDSQLKVLAHRVMQRMSLVGLFQLTIPPLELHQRLLGRNLVKLLLVSSETCNFCCSRPCCCHRSSCCGCSGLVLWAQVRSPALKARPLIPKVAGWRLSMTPRPASPLSVDVCAAVAAVHSQFTNSRRSAPTSLTGRQELTSRCNLRVDAVHPVVRRHPQRRRN